MPLFMGTAAALGAFPFWLLLNLPKGELMKQATDDLGNDDDYNSNDGDGSSNSGGSSSSRSSSSSSSSSGGGSDYSSAGNSGSGALGGGVSWSLFMVYALTAFVTGITICMVIKALNQQQRANLFFSSLDELFSRFHFFSLKWLFYVSASVHRVLWCVHMSFVVEIMPSSITSPSFFISRPAIACGPWSKTRPCPTLGGRRSRCSTCPMTWEEA